MYNNFDELIAGIHHSGNVISDSEPAIIIDGYKRTLTPEAGFNTQIGVTNDYNTNEITFKCDKTVDGHDLFQCNNKVIKWHNLASNIMGSDKLSNLDEQDESFTITWQIPPEATTKAGTLRIAICFCDIDEKTNKIVYKWNSLIYNGLQVGQGMDEISVAGIPLSNIIDVNVYSRAITLPAGFNTTIGIQGAPGATKLTFRVNRFFNDWDFNSENTEGYVLCKVNKVESSYKLDPQSYRIIESLSGNDKDDWIEFDWTVPAEIFNAPGTFTIALGFSIIPEVTEGSTEAKTSKAWRSKALSSLTIESSPFATDIVVPTSNNEGWLFISQQALTDLLSEQYPSVNKEV